jgi:hypothetical protein
MKLAHALRPLLLLPLVGACASQGHAHVSWSSSCGSPDAWFAVFYLAAVVVIEVAHACIHWCRR